MIRASWLLFVPHFIPNRATLGPPFSLSLSLSLNKDLFLGWADRLERIAIRNKKIPQVRSSAADNDDVSVTSAPPPPTPTPAPASFLGGLCGAI